MNSSGPRLRPPELRLGVLLWPSGGSSTAHAHAHTQPRDLVNSPTHTHTRAHTRAHTRTHADEGFGELAHSHTSSAQGRVRAAGLVNPECSDVVGVPPSHGPSEGGVGPRLVQVGERPQRATHNPPRGLAPDVRDCRIRHGPSTGDFTPPRTWRPTRSSALALYLHGSRASGRYLGLICGV